MNYIKKVILENFQSHKYTEIEFDQHLNVIVGPSDQGKTAIIRGIKWALFNEPTGDYFIREGESECSVTIVFGNNVKLKRYRNRNKNYYFIYDNEGNETILEGFGKKLPQEVIEKTSINKILLDSNVSNFINIGEQLEGPFLLSQTTATKANAIGRLVGVHIIDDALSDTLKDIKNLKSKKRNHEEALEKLNADLKEYNYLEDLVLKANRLREIKSIIYDKQERINVLTEKMQLIKYIDNNIFLCEKYLSKLKSLDKIIFIEKELEVKIRNFTYVFNRYEKLIATKNNIERDKTTLEALVHIKEIERIYNVLSLKRERIAKLTELYIKINKVKDNISRAVSILDKLKNIEIVEKNIELIEKKYNALYYAYDLKSRFDKVNKSLALGKVYIQKLSSIENIDNMKGLIELKYKRLENLLILKAQYDDNRESLENIHQKIANIEINLENLLKQYREALNNLEICPLCFSSISKERIEYIINSYK